MKLINTYKSIDRRVIYDCRVKSLMELMRHYGLNINEYEILLISRAILFSYDKISIPNIINKKIPYAAVSTNDIVENLFDELGINYKKVKIGASSEDWKTLKQLIDNDIPILFKIDSRFLNNNFDENKKQTLNLYYLSTLLLVGYDEEKEVVYIVLTNTNEIDRVTELSIDNFNKYRNTQCMPFKADYTCYYVEDDKEIRNIKRDKINELLKKGLFEISKLMLDDTVEYNVKIGAFDGTKLLRGITAMKELKKDLEDMLLKIDQIDKKTIKFIILFIRNNLMFGSHSAFRGEFASCLEHLSNLINDKYFFNISLEFKEIAKLWGKLFVGLTSIANEKNDFNDKLTIVIDTLDKIILKEEQQFKLINNYFNK